MMTFVVRHRDKHHKQQRRKSTIIVLIRRLKLQSTTRITEFFVVGKMSGILVGIVILVGQIPTTEVEVLCLFNKIQLKIGVWTIGPDIPNLNLVGVLGPCY